MKESKLLPETQSVLDLIEKVSNNPKDACYGKKKVELYKRLSKEAIKELKEEEFKLLSWEETEELTKPVDGIYHIVSWR
jgi:hypothetical protein